MTTPDYTPTAGPVDPNAPVVQKVYAAVSSLLVILGAASTFGLITADQAGALNNVGTALTALVGAAVTALAAFRTKKQLKNGTFDPAPAPVVVTASPELSTVDKITQAVQEVQALDSQVKDGIGKLTEITGGLVNIPGVLNMTPDLPGPLDDLVRGAGARYKTTQ